MTATAFAPTAELSPIRDEVAPFAISAIAPDPDQPRKDVDDGLAESIAAQGVLQPITIRTHPVSTGDVRFMIVDGERRWRGAQRAGFKTIPAIFRSDFDDEAERLIRQSVFNTGKPLTAMEEAKSWKRIQELTGKNIAELARMLGRPKSTVSDRIAMAEAPELFQPLFENRIFTAAAAPIARKYGKMPEKLLLQLLTGAEREYDWRRFIDAGKPIPLKVIEDVLEYRVRWTLGARQVTKALAPFFKGETFDLGEQQLTTDAKALSEAEAALAKQREKDTPAESAPRKDPYVQRYEREQARRRAESARFNKAKPQILAAFAEAIKKSPTGISANGRSAIAELVLKAAGGQGVTKDVLALLPVGSNAESIIRHCAFLQVVNVASQSYLREHQMPKLAKAFGVDVKKLIDAAAPKKKPAKKAAAKKKAKR